MTDRLADGTSLGNAYRLAASFTAGPISMATFVATNAQHFPDPFVARAPQYYSHITNEHAASFVLCGHDRCTLNSA